jgi:hypothetical protein
VDTFDLQLVDRYRDIAWVIADSRVPAPAGNTSRVRGSSGSGGGCSTCLSNRF